MEGTVVAFGGSPKTKMEEHLIVGTKFVPTVPIVRSSVCGLALVIIPAIDSPREFLSANMFGKVFFTVLL